MKDPHEKGVANHSAPSFARLVARPGVKRKHRQRVSPRLRGVRRAAYRFRRPVSATRAVCAKERPWGSGRGVPRVTAVPAATRFILIPVQGSKLGRISMVGSNESSGQVLRAHLPPCVTRQSFAGERRQGMCVVLPAMLGCETIPCSSASKEVAAGRIVPVYHPSVAPSAKRPDSNAIAAITSKSKTYLTHETMLAIVPSNRM